jgi:hypothetical protein
VILEPWYAAHFRTHTLGDRLPIAVIGEKVRQNQTANSETALMPGRAGDKRIVCFLPTTAECAEPAFRDRPVTFDSTSEQTSRVSSSKRRLRFAWLFSWHLLGGSSCLKDAYTVAYDSPFSSF